MRLFARILSVGGLTLLSRVVGFVRDVMLAAILGAGPIADAFLIAFRLPNHFRAIFGEGAFNAAFVPAYARIGTQQGPAAARLFADRIFSILFAAQAVLLALALMFTGGLVTLLAPGLVDDPLRYGLAVELTQITFPYLLLVTMVTLYGGILNTLDRFASAAAAPVFLNLCMIVTLALAALFPTAGHAAAWGVLISGMVQFLLVAFDSSRNGATVMFRRPRWDADVKAFFKALGPATLGSAGMQIAVFADTIIASFLPGGSLASLYYADRLNQLPIGVIGIAAGTVLLPEMARSIAQGDERGAHFAQNRAVELILLLALPCLVAFLLIPDLVMRALFGRGAFGPEEAAAAALVLQAYAVGLLPFVLMRAVVTTFHARADTVTPVIATSLAIVVNVGLKVGLVWGIGTGAAGLALATAVGGWINVGFLAFVGLRRGLIRPDRDLALAAAKLAAAALALAVVLFVGTPYLTRAFAGLHLNDELTLLALIALGALTYGGVVAALLGRRWLEAFRKMRRQGPAPKLPPVE